MRFGVCTSCEQAAVLKALGWDYVEEGVHTFLQGALGDAQWNGSALAARSPLPILAANMLVPAELKITGPGVDSEKLAAYMSRVIDRAGKTGIRTLVFGSGGARRVPDDFSRDTAKEQIESFLRSCAPILERTGATLVIEPLNRKECNIINSVAEALDYVNAVAHPNIQCLVDSYHFWLENEPLANLAEAMPAIRHVHVADMEGRAAPGKSGTSDYREFFRTLKDGSYSGDISVECSNFKDYKSEGLRVLEYLHRQWNEA
jgi:sugar phosphate isomerase/epimerase